MARILLVDDDLSIRTVVALMLSRSGHRVSTACDGAEALEVAKTTSPDVVLSDLWMPGMRGDVLLRQISQAAPATSCILMTGDGEQQFHSERLVPSFLQKPFSYQELLDAVDGALCALS